MQTSALIHQPSFALIHQPSSFFCVYESSSIFDSLVRVVECEHLWEPTVGVDYLLDFIDVNGLSPGMCQTTQLIKKTVNFGFQY